MKKRIHAMAQRTWQAIGGDVIKMLEEIGQKPTLTKDEVIETVCDADYMLTHGGDKEAYEFWYKLPDKKKYSSVAGAFLNKKYGL